MKHYPDITNREREIVHLIASEFTSKEISNILFISPDTAKTHRKNIMNKWKVKNAAGIVRMGFELGVITLTR